MTTITEKQAPHHHITKQEHGTEQEDSKIGAGKSFSFDDKNSGSTANTPATTTNTKTTNDTTITTTTTVQYDVEHLATFSTATSHEQQVGAASATTTTTTINDNHDESSKFKLKQAPTNDSSNITEPREALQKLFELEKLSGIWTQRMQIELQQDFMLIVDCETNSIVERFHKDRVTKPEAFNHYNDIYNNIVVFNIDQQRQQTEKTTKNNLNSEDCDKTSGELHIFQCVSHRAKQIVSDIQAWKSNSKQVSEIVSVLNEKDVKSTKQSSGPITKATDDGVDCEYPPNTKKEAIKMSPKDGSQETRKEVSRKLSKEGESTTASTPPADSTNQKPVVTVASSSKSSETVPIVNVNVKETVQVFNQIAALREKSSGVGQTVRPLSDASSSSQSGSSGSTQQQPSSTSSEFLRAHPGPSSQSYKQRSIRAILAPKPASDQKEESSPKNHNQDRPTSSSSPAEQTANSGAKFAVSSSTASSSQSGNHNLNSTMDQAASSEQALSSSSSSAEPTTNSHHDAKSQQQPSGQKHTTVHNNTTSHTRSSSSGHHHNHNHQHQHQHDQQKPPLVKGKSAGNKPGSASSRLPATNGHHHQNHNHHNNHQGAVQSSNSSGHSHGSPPLQQPAEQVTSNESYVSVLNHCFDDIEKFILRIQHAYAAKRELQAKKRHTKRSAAAANHQSNKSHPNGPLPPLPPQLSASELAMLVAQAQGPNTDDFFEILSKFKLAFNLLAKLKGCIHEPNAPELVHFLFTPLAIIIESARNLTPPVDPTVVGIPYLNRDALDLLSNCCTSKESDLWLSLGPNWTETIDAQLLKAARLPNSFQPIFSDGWAPVISELELIGLVVPPVSPEGDSHYCSSNARSSAGHLMMDEPIKGSRQVNHDETIRNGPPAPLPMSATNNGAPLLSNNKVFKAKRVSPNNALNPRYVDPVLQTGYMQSDYLREPIADMLEEPLAVADIIHPSGPYRVPELQMGLHQQQHRSTRNSVPTSEKSSRNGTKHSAHGVRSKRNSEYIGHGQYAPSSILNSSFMAPKDGHLDGRYPGYPSTNPSNDYTELQISSLQNGHYMAGPSGRHGEEPFSHGSSQHAPSDHSRRKGSKSSYNRPYLGEPHYEDHGHDLMAHEAEREAMLIDMGPAQTEWFYELKLRGALIVRVLFTREANNDKELTVKRGEILEILDDTRKWWKARNIDLQVAYVPHTIVAVMEHYQTLDELLTGSSSDMMMMMNEDQGANVDAQRYAYREPQASDSHFQNQYYGLREERRNSKTAKGAFRYF